MDVSDSSSRDRCVLHSGYSAKKGTKVPRKCLPRMEDEDQGGRRRERVGRGGGGGRQPLWEPGRGDPATENWTGERRASSIPGKAADVTCSSGLGSVPV